MLPINNILMLTLGMTLHYLNMLLTGYLSIKESFADFNKAQTI